MYSEVNNLKTTTIKYQLIPWQNRCSSIQKPPNCCDPKIDVYKWQNMEFRPKPFNQKPSIFIIMTANQVQEIYVITTWTAHHYLQMKRRQPLAVQFYLRCHLTYCTQAVYASGGSIMSLNFSGILTSQSSRHGR